MIRRPPRSPLLPYTTLFRSVRRAAEMIGRQVQAMTRLVDDLLEVSRITTGKVRLRLEPVELAAVVARAVETSRPLIDRKSTRLNSSHANISYAVFCLTKKQK